MKTKEIKVIKLDINQYGLQESKAKDIQNLYLPMIEMIGNIEEEFNEIVSMEQSPESAKLARNLRLRIVPVRTKADESRKQAKEEYLLANKAIQGAYNTFEYAVKSKEEKLKAIEEFEARKEEVRIHELSLERSDKLEKYEMYNVQGLGEMDEHVFNNLITGAKTTLEAKQEAEIQAKKERDEELRLNKIQYDRHTEAVEYKQFWIGEYNFRNMSQSDFENVMTDLKRSKEKHEKEQEKIRKENERLKKEAEKKALRDKIRNEELKPFIIYIRDYNKTLNLNNFHYQKELHDLGLAKTQEVKFKVEQAKLKADEEEKAEKERKEQETELQAEKDKAEYLKAELRAKAEAEAKEIKEAKQTQRTKELAPDKDKLTLWIESMNVDLPNLKSKDSEVIADDILFKFQSFKKWALKEITKLK